MGAARRWRPRVFIVARSGGSISAARQGLLAEYFVATDEDRAEGLKVPTAGHHAIAELVKGGWIKVILTTNFDRLMEQALDALGVAYQVIARPDATTGSTPIAHAAATIVKLHGDWSDLEFRNTVDELNTYPQPWVDVLRQVFNEYGLLISGWSAEWDKALVRVLEATPRRYPLYWDSRSSKSVVARNVLAQHDGHVITAESADELFTSIAASVDALTRLAEPPLTTAMAVARLKRALQDPLRRIELRDMVMDTTRAVNGQLIKASSTSGTFDDAAWDAYLDTLLEVTKPLLSLLIHGIRYDDGTHTDRWVEALQLLLDRPGPRPDGVLHTSDGLRTYPALLALRAASVEAVNQGKDDILVALLTRAEWDDPFNPGRSTLAADVLHLLNVIDNGFANRLPRWGGTKWFYPASHLLNQALLEFFLANDLDPSRLLDLSHDAEYRTGFVQHLLPTQPGRYRHRPAAGEFIDDSRWRSVNNRFDEEAPAAEIRFRNHIDRHGSKPWGDLLKGRDIDEELLSYRETLKKYKRFN